MANKKNKKYFIRFLGLITLFLIIGAFTYFKFFYNPVEKHDTLNYQSQKYYSTGFFTPNSNMKNEFIDASLISRPNKGEVKEIWKLNTISSKKLIITKNSDNSFITWTNRKIDTAKEALEFLNPQFLQYRVYDKKGTFETSQLKNTSENNQKRIVASLKKVVSNRPKYRLVTNLGADKSYVSTNEIYLFADANESISMQASLSRKSGEVYLEFAGEENLSYWKVIPDNLRNLK
ncbi:hypothetical protein [Lactococcus lactis]|uniref:hypothetical protein n=1 Tax=Lactococcus lactis TaxID=1358 RepID=UPI001F19BD34|nr:hypothetical protein [Lactococcus lactis]MCG1000651.1 hypothetical protein [Lactococcus lactis]MCT0050568.1 hypothetical protein [Lactococcus lactis subsp. lactis]MDG4973475.1 hypothetical protein [Lactococcus lactis]